MFCKFLKKKSFCVLSFFLFSLFSYSFSAYSKTIIISDIDDTIKKSNSAGKTAGQVYHFLRKVPYLEMRDFFNEIKEEERSRGETIKFYYVSAAKTFTFNAQKWLQKHNFPIGRSTLKERGEDRSTYDFKYAVVKKIMLDEIESLDVSSNEPLTVMMFGDNAQVDAVVYRNISEELKLNAKIFIRDVRGEATYFDSTLELKRVAGVNYFFSEVELFKFPDFNFISTGLLNRTFASYKNRELIPQYTAKTLMRRLHEIYGDKDQAQSDSAKYWNDYYLRF